MLCGLIGIVAALLVRLLLIRTAIDPYVGPRALVYRAWPSSSPSSSGWGSSESRVMTDDQVPSVPGSRRLLGRLIGAGIVGAAVIAVIVTLLQWETRPQTDDATVRANFVGIAPQVNGHIVELRVRDNQQVKQGDLLFLIDPRPYEIALARAQAALALTRKEVEGLRNGVSSAASGVAKAAAQLDASAADVGGGSPIRSPPTRRLPVWRHSGWLGRQPCSARRPSSSRPETT